MPTYLQFSPIPDLEGSRAVQRVQRYYRHGGDFSGRCFEFLGGGGDRTEVADQFTAEDLVAVSMLSVQVPSNAAIQILDTDAEELSELLGRIPRGTTLWEADVADIDDKTSPAADLWKRLERIKGVGWVTANKLLARKRPHLLPVYDRVVKAKLQPRSKELWIPLRNSLLKNDEEILNRLRDIKEQAQLEVDPPLLRILDVAVWMSSER
jgi:hypothetical protein